MTKELFIAKVLPLRDKCFRYAVSILNNVQESEDVAQEILLKMWARRTELSQVNNLEAWAVRATRNLSLDKMKHSSWQTKNVDALFDKKSKEVSPEVSTEQKEAVSAVFSAMQQLPELQRSILHMREIDQKTYEEIAQALALSTSQVKVYLHRARTKLRQLLHPSHSPTSEQ